MKEVHHHEIDLSIGIIRFYPREPNLNYRVVTHGGIEKAILRDSELDKNWAALDGKIISARSEILYDVDIEELGFKDGFLLKVPSRILLHAHPEYKKEVSKISLTILRYGDYGCATMPIKNGEIDWTRNDSGNYHIKISDAFRDDEDKLIEESTTKEDTQVDINPKKYKCRIILPPGKFKCWNDAVKEYLGGDGDMNKIGIGLDDPWRWNPWWGKFHKKYRLFIEGNEVKC